MTVSLKLCQYLFIFLVLNIIVQAVYIGKELFKYESTFIIKPASYGPTRWVKIVTTIACTW